MKQKQARNPWASQETGHSRHAWITDTFLRARCTIRGVRNAHIDVYMHIHIHIHEYECIESVKLLMIKSMYSLYSRDVCLPGFPSACNSRFPQI
jgi:hypothetical protein